MEVVENGQPTTKCKRQADVLFDEIQQARCFKSYKLEEKRRWMQQLVFTVKKANYLGKIVMFPRNKNHEQWSAVRQQVVDASVEVGLFDDCRSQPGHAKTSCILPTERMKDLLERDPWEFDAARRQLVLVRRRHTGEELPFDPNHPTAVLYAKKLTRINDVNSQFVITAGVYDEWSRSMKSRRVVRSWHFGSFTDDFDHHGRIYTSSAYGHNEMRKIERMTIQFNGSASTEKDFKAFHCTLLYHLRRFECTSDPYLLWGRKTTGAQRLLAKTLINCMINAENEQAALSAANNAMNHYTPKKKRKTGKDLEDAKHLYEAYRQAGIKFSAIIPLVMKTHNKIRNDFFVDKGMELMNIDGLMALNIMYRMVRKGYPCLGVHDSFVVPLKAESELITTMINVYQKRTGFVPNIK